MSKVLLLDEDRDRLCEQERWLSLSDCDATVSTSYGDSLKAIATGEFDAAVCAVGKDIEKGFGLLSQGLAASGNTRFILTALKSELCHVLRALKQGAYSYMKKPLEERDFVHAIESACQDKEAMERVNIQLGEAGWVELQMPSSERTMHRLDRFFRLMYEEQVDEETLEDVSLCFREVVRNAIEWGHKFDITKRVKISHMLFQDEFVFKIEDNGEGYDISTILEGSENLIAMEDARENAGKRPGGLGMTMVRSLMDQVIYNRSGNMIVLSKRLATEENSPV